MALCWVGFTGRSIQAEAQAPVAERVRIVLSYELRSSGIWDADMSGHTPRHRTGTPARYRVTFAQEVMGVRFPIASVEVRRAHNADRALRVAELRFSRRFGQDWRMRANVEEVEAV